MEDKILYLEDYKKILELQKQYEDGIITEGPRLPCKCRVT